MFNGHDQRQSFPDFIEDYMAKEEIREGTCRRIRVVTDCLKKAGMLLRGTGRCHSEKRKD